MNRKKVLLGILIVAMMSICGMFFEVIPSVFAMETSAIESITNEAGIFYGQGYYETGGKATLIAEMNPGYEFVAWVSIDADDNIIEVLGTEQTCEINISNNMNIRAEWKKIEYTIDFVDELKIDGQLKDFDCPQISDIQQSNKYYYNDEIEIKVSTKEDLFIYDLEQKNIILKNATTNSILQGYDIAINNGNEGFKDFVIKLNIKENILIDIDYVYMYNLEIKSGDQNIPLSKIINFVTISDHYTKLDDYNYLARADKEVIITISKGDSVYKFNNFQLSGYDPEDENKSYLLEKNSILLLNYSKIGYDITFKPYVINIYGEYDEMQRDLYDVDAIENVTAGESVAFEYNDDTREITINNSTKYQYPSNVYGYKFVGFYNNGTKIIENEYTLSDTAPTDVEIQLVFEYIRYSLQLQLVDDYFKEDKALTYSYTINNAIQQLIVGAKVQLQASTSKYCIIGWSFSATPKADGYFRVADKGAVSDSCEFDFEPLSDDNSQVYTIYLDVDYAYYNISYSLRENSISKNVSYDIVSVDLTNKVLIFIDSEQMLIDKTVNYLDSDIVSNENIITISTEDFGDVVIKDDVLSYIDNGVEVKSSSKVDESGVSIYTFDKYTYFGQLQVGLIEYLTLSQNNSDVIITINGNIYSETGVQSGEIQRISTTMYYNPTKLAYLIDYQYEMYLYMNEDSTQYDYIILRGIKYCFDGEKFVVMNATINTPKNIEYNVTKKSSYSINLSNLTPNALIMYLTKSTNEASYGFTGLYNELGTKLWNFQYDDVTKACVLNVESIHQVIAEYRRFENNITLRINKENAYDYANITFSVNGMAGTGKTISALDGEEIVIVIFDEYIGKGYKFEGYQFNQNDLTDVSNPKVLQITMDSRVYSNKIIDICFTEIDYTININYIDKNSNIIDENNIKGKLVLEGSETRLNSMLVNLSNEYSFNAISVEGYYVGDAYIGTKAYIIDSLASSNTWKLNINNFEQAIIDNADSENIINLYICFTIHTYSVKVYFEIDENASSITYPTLYINNIEKAMTVEQEQVNGISTTKYFVLEKGYEYNSNVRLEVSKFMLGTSLQKWKDINGVQLTNSNQYTVNQINKDVVLTIVLQYDKYSIEFVVVNEQNEPCNYGSASSNNAIIKLFDNVNYTVNSAIGYVLKEKYYYNSESQIGDKSIESGFIFNPLNFKIEDGYKFKIYLVFTVKVVNLTISNKTEGNMYYFKDKDATELASYTVTRQRGNNIQILNDEIGYEFMTGDILTMQITPISMGIDLSLIKLGNISITTLSEGSYKLTANDIVEDNNIVGMYYNLIIEFTPSLIDALDNEVELNNILISKIYNITYTYNFINFEFGITLIRQYNNATAYGDEDVALNISNVGFGSSVMFSYVYEGMATGIGNKFKVNGFTIEGLKQDEINSFTLEDIILWEQLALIKYQQKTHNISVVLMLSPKITLENYTEYNEETGYLYERTYIGERQGLIVDGNANFDIIVGGNFEIGVKYDSGMGLSNTKPIDVGDYRVEITAKITSQDSQTINVVFDEIVVYRIIPASLQISFETYNSSNPICKTYDGTNNLISTIVVKDIKLNGLFLRDEGRIYVDENRLSAKLSGISVNSNSALYDVNLFDIYLLDSSNNNSSNYKLASGRNLVFTRIGKINPKELTITGFKPYNKVYDGNSDVQVNLDEIDYVGKLASDSTQILTDNLRFYLENYEVGVSRQVKIDWQDALSGADSINYSVVYDTKYIDIYPYEISYTLEGFGTFKIVDVDRLCLIPIGSKITARVFERGSLEYRSLYSLVEGSIDQGEKLKYLYEITMKIGFVEQLIPEGLYLFVPKVNKATKVVQINDGEYTGQLKYSQQDDYTVIKVEQGDGSFAIMARTAYLPLWMIILIVCLILLLIVIIIVIVLIIRRKAKNKYSAYDRI